MPEGDEPKVHVAIARGSKKEQSPSCYKPSRHMAGGILSPKMFQFHMSWWCSLFVPGQRVSLCPPAHPLCPAAALFSRADLDEGGVDQPGRWQNPHLPFV